jgi:hypothetical protein
MGRFQTKGWEPNHCRIQTQRYWEPNTQFNLIGE